jgi:Protein of unknown function (DUF2505)
MKLHVDHRFVDVTLFRFEHVYFSENFNNAAAKHSGLKSRKLVEQTIAADGKRTRRVRLQPDVSIPTALSKWVKSEDIAYDEVSTFDPRLHEVRYHIDSKMSDRVKMSGVIQFVADGTGVRRTVDGDIDVNAPFGVGLVVEKFIEAEVRKAYEKLRPFVVEFLRTGEVES